MSETEDPRPTPGIRVLGQASPAPEDLVVGDVDQEDVVTDSPASDPAGRSVRPGVLLTLVLVAFLGVIGTVTFGLLWVHDQSQQSGASSIQAASRSVAQRFLRDFTTFNPSTVDRTFADIQAISTGSFASQAKAEFSASLRQQLRAANASTQGQVRYLELQAHTNNSASYYADVVQTYSNDKTSGPRSDELRLVVSLRLENGQWKVSGVTSLDTPAVPSG